MSLIVGLTTEPVPHDTVGEHLQGKLAKRLLAALGAGDKGDFFAVLEKNKNTYGVAQTVNSVLLHAITKGVKKGGGPLFVSELLVDARAGFLHEIITPSFVATAAKHLMQYTCGEVHRNALYNLELFVERQKFDFDNLGTRALDKNSYEMTSTNERAFRMAAAFYNETMQLGGSTPPIQWKIASELPDLRNAAVQMGVGSRVKTHHPAP